MGKIFSAIDKQIIRPRVNASYNEGISATIEDIMSFYFQGNPKRYVRTGAYGDSPNGTPPSGGNGKYDYSIYLERPEYNTGTPGFPVLEQAQCNGSGILGRPNTWHESEEDIIEAVIRSFS